MGIESQSYRPLSNGMDGPSPIPGTLVPGHSGINGAPTSTAKPRCWGCTSPPYEPLTEHPSNSRRPNRSASTP